MTEGRERNAKYDLAKSVEGARRVLRDPYFWLGYREAFDGLPFVYDRDFGIRDPDSRRLAQLRYENGREIALCALSDGVVVPWRSHQHVGTRLLRWWDAARNPARRPDQTKGDASER